MGFTYRSKLSGGAASSSISSGVVEANHTIRAIPAATITITGATNATPIIVTAVAHGLVTGDAISISGITGNTNANGYFKITRLTADTFSLQNYSTGADIAGNGAYGGTPVAVTGIVQANRVMVGDGTAAAPSVAFATDPGYGYYKSGANIGLSAGGVIKHGWNSSGYSVYDNAAQFSLRAASDAILTWPAAATLQLGAANAASPVGQRLKVQDATGTNVAAATPFNIDGPNGTGNAAVGATALRTGAVQASGATAHVPVARLTVKELHINLRLGDVNVYANNAAAIAGGLVAGDLYRTGADPDPIMIVH